MNIISVASINPVKLEATLAGFKRMFPRKSFEVRAVKIPAPVSDQPMTDEETLEGAEARALHAMELTPEADYWVGIEGGVMDRGSHLSGFAWVVILSEGKRGIGRSGEFFLPENVAELVRQGVELGEADDRVFSRNNSKQTNGAIGLLTGDAIDRLNLYIPAVIFALIPFKNPDLY
ncbi:MAG: putative non-canonical purine NTP phosphatase [Chloroflexi bacterium]|nr:MAG: putative non-canonical purine NTP phosphatase [Chloroflexota bacterium]MBA4375784.1 inosine/xanthosine triphosphatase [Anaerolinea sp.]